MARKLGPEERALWERVIASVSPLHPEPGKAAEAKEAEEAKNAAPPMAPAPRRRGRTIPGPVASRRPVVPGTTLDGTWDRKLSRGLVHPDMVIDLHGHNLATAYHLLDTRLQQALLAGARIVLLVTGKPPVGEPPVSRGRIRAAMGDWLAASRHARDIAAVRSAHPRHGGQGALYIILRRGR